MADPTCAGCSQPIDVSESHVAILRNIERHHDRDPDSPTMVLDSRTVELRHDHDDCARQPGLVVDGDMLRDAITEAAPREWTDAAARELAGRALDGAVRAGLTVLHGPDHRPRAVAAAPADAGETMPDLLAALQASVDRARGARPAAPTDLGPDDRPALTLCPTCKSSQPHLHPTQDVCTDPYHRPVPASLTEWRREVARWADLLDSWSLLDPTGDRRPVHRIVADMRREVVATAAPVDDTAAPELESLRTERDFLAGCLRASSANEAKYIGDSVTLAQLLTRLREIAEGWRTGSTVLDRDRTIQMECADQVESLIKQVVPKPAAARPAEDTEGGS